MNGVWQAIALVAVTTFCIVVPSLIYFERRERRERKAESDAQVKAMAVQAETQLRCHEFQRSLADQTNRAFIEVVGVLTQVVQVLERVEKHLTAPPTCANYQQQTPRIT